MMNFIKSKYGQWAYPGQNTLIPNADGRITMKGVNYPVLGIDDKGNRQMMMPGAEYQFPGNDVYEIPMAQPGINVSGPRAEQLPVDHKGMNAMMKARLAYEQMHGNPAATRMVAPTDNPYIFPSGAYGTHFMSSYDNYAIPEIQSVNGVLKMTGPRNEEAMRFDRPEDADYFAADNYKRISPAFIEAELTDEEIEEYQKGGYIVEELSKAQPGMQTSAVLPPEYLRSQGFVDAANEDLNAILGGFNADGYDSHYYTGKVLDQGATDQQLRKFSSEYHPKSFLNAAAYAKAMNELAVDAGGKNVSNIPFADNPTVMRTEDDDIEYQKYYAPKTIVQKGKFDPKTLNAIQFKADPAGMEMEEGGEPGPGDPPIYVKDKNDPRYQEYLKRKELYEISKNNFYKQQQKEFQWHSANKKLGNYVLSKTTQDALDRGDMSSIFSAGKKTWDKPSRKRYDDFINSESWSAFNMPGHWETTEILNTDPTAIKKVPPGLGNTGLKNEYLRIKNLSEKYGIQPDAHHSDDKFTYDMYFYKPQEVIVDPSKAAKEEVAKEEVAKEEVEEIPVQEELTFEDMAMSQMEPLDPQVIPINQSELSLKDFNWPEEEGYTRRELRQQEREGKQDGKQKNIKTNRVYNIFGKKIKNRNRKAYRRKWFEEGGYIEAELPSYQPGGPAPAPGRAAAIQGLINLKTFTDSEEEKPTYQGFLPQGETNKQVATNSGVKFEKVAKHKNRKRLFLSEEEKEKASQPKPPVMESKVTPSRINPAEEGSAYDAFKSPVDFISAKTSGEPFYKHEEFRPSLNESGDPLIKLGANAYDQLSPELQFAAQIGQYAIPYYGPAKMTHDFLTEVPEALEAFIDDPSLANAGMLGLYSAMGIPVGSQAFKGVKNVYKNPKVLNLRKEAMTSAITPIGYDIMTPLAAPLEALTPKSLKYAPKTFATKNRFDAWRLYNGLKPKHNTFFKNADGTLAINDFRLALDDLKKIINNPKKSFGTMEIENEFNFGAVHGNGWITKGVDKQGRKYIDFTDTWDLQPLKKIKGLPKKVRDFEVSSMSGGKPYDLKNRIYYDDAGNFFDHSGNKLIEEVQQLKRGVLGDGAPAQNLTFVSTPNIAGVKQMDVLKDWGALLNQKAIKGALTGAGGVGLGIYSSLPDKREGGSIVEEDGPGDPPKNEVKIPIGYDRHGNKLDEYKKRGTIYVTDPNDPRLKEYEQRKELYDTSKHYYTKKVKSKYQRDKEEMKKRLDKQWAEYHKDPVAFEKVPFKPNATWIKSRIDNLKEDQKAYENYYGSSWKESGWYGVDYDDEAEHAGEKDSHYNILSPEGFDKTKTFKVRGQKGRYHGSFPLAKGTADLYGTDDYDPKKGVHLYQLDRKFINLLTKGMNEYNIYPDFYERKGYDGMIPLYKKPELIVKYADPKKYDWAAKAAREEVPDAMPTRGLDFGNRELIPLREQEETELRSLVKPKEPQFIESDPRTIRFKTPFDIKTPGRESLFDERDPQEYLNMIHSIKRGNKINWPTAGGRKNWDPRAKGSRGLDLIDFVKGDIQEVVPFPNLQRRLTRKEDLERYEQAKEIYAQQMMEYEQDLQDRELANLFTKEEGGSIEELPEAQFGKWIKKYRKLIKPDPIMPRPMEFHKVYPSGTFPISKNALPTTVKGTKKYIKNFKPKRTLQLESPEMKFDRSLAEINRKSSDNPIITRVFNEKELVDDLSGLKSGNVVLDEGSTLGRRTKHFGARGEGAVMGGDGDYNTMYIGNIDDVKRASDTHIRDLNPGDTYFYNPNETFTLSKEGVYLTSDPVVYENLLAAGKPVKLEPGIFDESRSLADFIPTDESTILKNYDRYYKNNPSKRGSSKMTTQDWGKDRGDKHFYSVNQYGHGSDILSELEHLDIIPYSFLEHNRNSLRGTLNPLYMFTPQYGKSLKKFGHDYSWYNQWVNLPKKVRESELKKLNQFYKNKVMPGKVKKESVNYYKNRGGLEAYQKDYKLLIDKLEELNKMPGPSLPYQKGGALTSYQDKGEVQEQPQITYFYSDEKPAELWTRYTGSNWDEGSKKRMQQTLLNDPQLKKYFTENPIGTAIGNKGFEYLMRTRRGPFAGMDNIYEKLDNEYYKKLEDKQKYLTRKDEKLNNYIAKAREEGRVPTLEELREAGFRTASLSDKEYNSWATKEKAINARNALLKEKKEKAVAKQKRIDIHGYDPDMFNEQAIQNLVALSKQDFVHEEDPGDYGYYSDKHIELINKGLGSFKVPEFKTEQEFHDWIQQNNIKKDDNNSSYRHTYITQGHENLNPDYKPFREGNLYDKVKSPVDWWSAYSSDEPFYAEERWRPALSESDNIVLSSVGKAVEGIEQDAPGLLELADFGSYFIPYYGQAKMAHDAFSYLPESTTRLVKDPNLTNAGLFALDLSMAIPAINKSKKIYSKVDDALRFNKADAFKLPTNVAPIQKTSTNITPKISSTVTQPQKSSSNAIKPKQIVPERNAVTSEGDFYLNNAILNDASNALYKQGGSIEMELDDDAIMEYAQAGYIVEELPEAQIGKMVKKVLKKSKPKPNPIKPKPKAKYKYNVSKGDQFEMFGKKIGKREGVPLESQNVLSKSEIDEVIDNRVNWIKSPEYKKRRSEQTGESYKEIEKSINEYVDEIDDLVITFSNSPKWNAAGQYTPKREEFWLNRLFKAPKYTKPKIDINVSGYNNKERLKNVLSHEFDHMFSPLFRNQNFNYPKLPYKGVSKRYFLSTGEQQAARNQLDRTIRQDLKINNFDPITENQIKQWDASSIGSRRMRKPEGFGFDHVERLLEGAYDAGMTKENFMNFLNKGYGYAPFVLGTGYGFSNMDFQEGGFSDVELTDREALMYAQNGYIVEEL